MADQPMALQLVNALKDMRGLSEVSEHQKEVTWLLVQDGLV